MRRLPAFSSLARQYAAPVLIQAVGTGATLALTIGLARFAGPDTQAVFAKYRYWTDLCLSLALLGLPQAFVYAINKKHVSASALSTLSGAYAFAAFAPVALLAWLSVNANMIDPIAGVSAWVTAALTAAAVCILIYQRLARSVHLTQGGEISFSVITALPAISLLVAYVALYPRFETFRYDILYLVAALSSLGISIAVGPRGQASPARERRPIGETVAEVRPSVGLLFSHSSHSVTQAGLLTAQPAASVWLIEHFGGRLADVSFFNIATLTIVLCNLAFQYLAPLVFNRWSNIDANLNLSRALRIALLTGLMFGVCAALASPAAPFVLTFGVGPEYIQAVSAVQILAFAAAPVVFARIISPAIHASGRPDLNTAGGLVRLLVVLAVQLGLMLADVSPLNAAAIAWLVGEWVAAAVLIAFVVQLHRGRIKSGR